MKKIDEFRSPHLWIKKNLNNNLQLHSIFSYQKFLIKKIILLKKQ